MSSPDGSPSPLPGSPTKDATVAVDEENAAPRTPFPHAPVNGVEKTNYSYPVEVAEPRNPGEVVQIPSTAPPTMAATHRPEEAHRSDQVKVRPTEDLDEPSSDSDTVASEGTGTDLPVFDWVDLQHRYTKAIQAVNQEEEDILEEFYKYSDAFSVWGGASANRDNERASKRLRTREKFVRLGEASLEEKKEHYTEVVDAFKKALALLCR
ncbi:hypothetical protein N431DRAFT_414791 [Stipitochalara longipes BDJ]|nr:hypothetical protein N431DRAFT_414791 [Stipitochalara longipes BDJ]